MNSRAGSTSKDSDFSFELRLRTADELGFEADRLAPLLERMGPLAIVDLETTGLSTSRGAEILEFGIVVLDLASHDETGEAHFFSSPKEGVEVRTLEGLLQPSQPLPRAIARLTGISERDLEGAPRLADVRYRVAEALANRTLIAHNAEFEREFLSRYVSPDFKQTVFLDTQDVLALTHPDSADLRLASFTRLLLEREEEHRALADALDTGRILACIAEGAARGDARYNAARRALDRFAPDSPWQGLLEGPFMTDEDEALPLQFIAIETGRHDPVPFDEEAIAAALADEERGREYFPGYRVREEQIELARHFVRNLDRGETLLLEGGTGVGKSLAYLSAIIPFVAQQKQIGVREPIVISTRTKLLQDQLLRKDIAAAARFLGYEEVRALSIKGRANYVCQRRLDRVLEEGRDIGVFPEERFAYAVLMASALTRPHAEIGNLPAALLRRYPALRDLRRRSVARRSEHCSREECARTPGCPFGRRRAALARADLIVANHDLLLRWPPDYPRFTHVIADEAHELAGVADDVYAQVVAPDEIIERIDEIFGRPSNRDDGVLLPEALRRRVAADVVQWRRDIDLSLSALGKSLTGRASEYGEVQLPRDPERNLPESAEIARLAAERIDEVAGQAELLAREMEEREEGENPVIRSAQELRSAASGLRVAFAGMEEFVSSFEGMGFGQSRWRLAIRPVSPAESFHTAFMEDLDSFAAVSASLFVAGTAFASLGELEVEERTRKSVARVTVESPFPYRDNMRVVALKPVPDPTAETTAVIELLARELGGRTLGLFTSLKRMNEVAEQLELALEGSGIEILSPQRALDDPASLVERFVHSRGGAVLLGARTFWQGLDLPGDDLQAVVIEKLPFEVPTELRKRREDRIRAFGGNPFAKFAMGKMLLHLKQMTGRLIRSEGDTGVAVIVDGRTDRQYFRRLGDALPTGTQVRAIRRHQLIGVLAEVGLGGAPRD